MRSGGYSEATLLHFAFDHLASAKSLFERSPSCFDSTATLSCRGIELILEAILLHRNNEFPFTHGNVINTSGMKLAIVAHGTTSSIASSSDAGRRRGT